MKRNEKGRMRQHPAKNQSVAKRGNQTKSTTPSRAAKRPRRATAVEQAQMAHALLSAVIDGGESTDDAHARYELPSSVEQRAWGAITTRLLAEGVLRRVGDAHTRRSVAHGRRIGRYVTADVDRARQYRDSLATTAARTRPTQRTLFAGGEGEP